MSPSFYDGTCEKVSTSETGEGPDTLPPEIPVLPELSCPDGTDYSAEEVSAWAYAKQYGISTMSSACDARLHDYLTRAEMAKIAVQYIKTHLPERIPNLNKDCTKFARSIQKYKGTDLYDYMVEACQYEVMGIHTVDYTAVSNFMPDKFVTRAEF